MIFINYIARSSARIMTAALSLMAAMVLVAGFSSPTYAAKGKNKNAKSGQTTTWQQIDESNLRRSGAQPEVSPEKYLVFRLNQTSLQNLLTKLPAENTEAARENPLIMEIPMPDGSLQRFRMEENQVLSPELAAQYPNWKTFIGYSIENPGVTGRFDWNLFGFHGYVFTEKGVVMIDPYRGNDKENYLVFYKHDFGKPSTDFYCRVEHKMEQIIKTKSDFELVPLAPAFSFGDKVKTYRIAIATTGEWARAAANYTPGMTPQQIRDGALAKIATAVTRLSGIYERELATKFVLNNPPTNDNNVNIVFDDPATDPYNNTDQAEDNPNTNPPTINQLRVNRETINVRRGVANYDIGHLFGTGGGGVATSPSLCDTDKAEGYSARNTMTGDPFVVDYVAHEIGHQFGSNHTYNNVDLPNTGACPQSSYSMANAYEPGSGSTIMSYVGICGARNLQQYVDTGIPAFHIKSLTVINTYITTGAPQTTGCGTLSAETNNVPTISAGNSYTIPKLTPFTLTATGNDADANDVANLLYSWEEYNQSQAPSGPAGMPANTYDVDTDNVIRPLFRVYSPVSSRSRTFPSMAFILNPDVNNDASADVNGVRGNQPKLTYTGTHPTGAPGAVCDPDTSANNPCVIGERLPTINRTMNFRVSVRDRRGGVADAGTSLNIVQAAGPFQVTSQNATGSWQGNSTQTVTWDVAGTTANGINAANVNILLSTDGGQTFPIMLKANTPNDGSEPITVPNSATTTARVKVEAAGNVFFDINNVNLTITAAPVAPVKSRADFDGDGRTDVSVYRSSEGNWYINRSTAGFTAVKFGTESDVLAPGDFDGDGKADISVFRSGTWFRLNSSNNAFSAVQFGVSSDVPVVGDYDGDQKDDIAVWRASDGVWYRINSANGQFVAQQFGSNGDTPVNGDFNGDGKRDLAVFRSSNNTWYIARITGTPAQNFDAIQFGTGGDIPVPADYDGDNKEDVAVFRPSNGTWYRLNSTNGQLAAVQFGTSTDVPAPGDYDGDGKDDQAVYRNNGDWYMNRSTSGFAYQQFGLAGDKVIPNSYLK